MAYVRAEDGILTSMHDSVPSGGAGHRVVTFNPGKNRNQISKLRLIIPGEETVEVRVSIAGGAWRSNGRLEASR